MSGPRGGGQEAAVTTAAAAAAAACPGSAAVAAGVQYPSGPPTGWWLALHAHRTTRDQLGLWYSVKSRSRHLEGRDRSSGRRTRAVSRDRRSAVEEDQLSTTGKC